MLKISLACGYYDRTAALFDGRVKIEGCEGHFLRMDVPGEIFHRAFRFQEFDVTELSLSTHLITTARGEAPYVAVPAFPLRKFRHSSIYIRTDRGIEHPSDLRGKTIGVPEFQQTANVWVRGMLDDHYGVDIRSIRWRTGGRDEPGREERTSLDLPDNIDAQAIPGDQTLSDMLERGDLDAIISPRPPKCFARRDKSPVVELLFRDYPAAELDYFQSTRIFPIMHVVGIRRELVMENPWLPVNVFNAFLEAKRCVKFRNVSMLPWADAEYERMKRLLGEDYWSYHFEPNKNELEKFISYSLAQGLIDRVIQAEKLFWPSTCNVAKA